MRVLSGMKYAIVILAVGFLFKMQVDDINAHRGGFCVGVMHGTPRFAVRVMMNADHYCWTEIANLYLEPRITYGPVDGYRVDFQRCRDILYTGE